MASETDHLAEGLELRPLAPLAIGLDQQARQRLALDVEGPPVTDTPFVRVIVPRSPRLPSGSTCISGAYFSGRTQKTPWPGVVIGRRNFPSASVFALANEPYSMYPLPSLSVLEYASSSTPAAGVPSGVSTRPVIGCGRPHLDGLEERPLAEPLVLPDHAQGVAEPGPRGVVGVLDVQLDVEVALGDLLGRDREGVRAVVGGGVPRLLEHPVLARLGGSSGGRPPWPRRSACRCPCS